MCLFIQAQFQLGSYIHACTNETHSVANLQDLVPTLAGLNVTSTNQPKEGLSFVDSLENVAQIVANAACRVGSQ